MAHRPHSLHRQAILAAKVLTLSLAPLLAGGAWSWPQQTASFAPAVITDSVKVPDEQVNIFCADDQIILDNFLYSTKVCKVKLVDEDAPVEMTVEGHNFFDLVVTFIDGERAQAFGSLFDLFGDDVPEKWEWTFKGCQIEEAAVIINGRSFPAESLNHWNILAECPEWVIEVFGSVAESARHPGWLLHTYSGIRHGLEFF